MELQFRYAVNRPYAPYSATLQEAARQYIDERKAYGATVPRTVEVQGYRRVETGTNSSHAPTWEPIGDPVPVTTGEPDELPEATGSSQVKYAVNHPHGRYELTQARAVSHFVDCMRRGGETIPKVVRVQAYELRETGDYASVWQPVGEPVKYATSGVGVLLQEDNL